MLPNEVYKSFSDNDKFKEDLVEAFCGALDNILNKYVSIGYGTMVVYNMLNIIFRDFEFTTESNAPKTRMEQIISMIDTTRTISQKTITLKKPTNIPSNIWDEVLDCAEKILRDNGFDEKLSSNSQNSKKDPGINEIIEQNDKGSIITKVYLNKKGSDVLKEKGIYIKEGTLLGRGIDPTKKPSSTEAYKNSISKLSELGVDDKWIEKQHKEKDRFGLERLDEVKLKARQQNKKITEVRVVNPKSLKADKYFQIIGEDKNGREYIIHTYVAQNKKGSIKQETINSYLDD